MQEFSILNAKAPALPSGGTDPHGYHQVSLGEGDGTPLQYSCLENPMDGGAWLAAVYGVARMMGGPKPSWRRADHLSQDLVLFQCFLEQIHPSKPEMRGRAPGRAGAGTGTEHGRAARGGSCTFAGCSPEHTLPRASPGTRPACHRAAPRSMCPATDVCVRPQRAAASTDLK